MAISSFVPEIWSAALLTALEKNLVFGGSAVVNRDYEGDISAAGDTVRITSISDPTIGDYVPGTTSINPEQLFDSQRSLLIDQCKYFAFEVDDVQARQAAGNVLPEATRRSAYKLADTVDQYIAGLYTGAQSANVVSAVTIDHSTTTASDQQYEWNKVWDQILVPLGVKLDEANVQQEGRYALLPPWLMGALVRDNRFVRVNESGSTDGMRKGLVGMANNMEIYRSNNCPQPTTNNYIVQAGVNSAITYAEQISKVEAYRPQDSFSDAIKGLHLYGARLVRPESIAYATAIYQA